MSIYISGSTFKISSSKRFGVSGNLWNVNGPHPLLHTTEHFCKTNNNKTVSILLTNHEGEFALKVVLYHNCKFTLLWSKVKDYTSTEVMGTVGSISKIIPKKRRGWGKFWLLLDPGSVLIYGLTGLQNSEWWRGRGKEWMWVHTHIQVSFYYLW